MLYLFNDVVFELGDVTELLVDGVIPLTLFELEELTTADLTLLVRDAIFHDPDFQRNKPEHARHLAAMLVHRAPEANALLAVRYPDATGPEGVGVGYASAPLTTLSYLWSLQSEGALTANVINDEVWNHVSGVLPSDT
jgi:hypothetical protein